MHFWLHYPRIINQNGPPVHYSCMKFEREHKSKKEAAEGTKSNINLPLTIAIRHQLQFCYFVETHNGVYNDVSLGPPTRKQETGEKNTVFLLFVEILGKKIRNDSVIVTEFNNDGVHSIWHS